MKLKYIFIYVYFSFIKESLNWLLQNKEYDKALDLIKEIGRTNNRPLDTENLLLSEYSEKLKVVLTNGYGIHLNKQINGYGIKIRAKINHFWKTQILKPFKVELN